MKTKQIAWNTGGGNIILTYQGQGNGTIVVSSDDNKGAARNQVVTVETLDGTKSVNLTVNQAACPVPIGTVLNYAYTGSYQEVELPAGEYKLQCWGAQGGSNGANSSYGITAQSGGKGGYSEGVITLTQKTTLRVYVGGQGSASAGGFNGGGSTTGTAQYSSGNVFGYSKMGGGGGASDIRLSDGLLLSRMIVAGGGSGGAMCYKKQTTETTITDYTFTSVDYSIGSFYALLRKGRYVAGRTYHISGIPSGYDYDVKFSNGDWTSADGVIFDNQETVTAPSGYNYMHIYLYGNSVPPSSFTIIVSHTETSTTTSNESQIGYVGGGTSGGGYSSTYQGRQNAGGSGGSFGQGANQSVTNYRYCSGAGGGGWYGGGASYSDSYTNYVRCMGGGSGWVNTSASAGNRPSGYTGLELDSGSTYDGSQTFKAPSGSNETGHSGNGYARITRLS